MESKSYLMEKLQDGRLVLVRRPNGATQMGRAELTRTGWELRILGSEARIPITADTITWVGGDAP